ncbi:MAG TPA: hypothetical protein VIP77_22070 [Jiangellaceae bacterium]
MTRRRSAVQPVRWCENGRCERLAVVLVSDLEGFQAWLCRDHWHRLYRRTRGAIHAVQILTRNWRSTEWD